MHGSFGHAGTKVKIRSGVEGAGRCGEMICYVRHDARGSQTWIVLVWDGEDEPDLFKANCLLFKHIGETLFHEEDFS